MDGGGGWGLGFGVVGEELVLFVEVVVFGEDGDELGYLFYGVFGVLGDFASLEAEHEHAVEGVEAGFDFAGYVFAGLGAQLDDEGEGFVEEGGVGGETRVFEERLVEGHELVEDVVVHLQVSVLLYAFATHHVDEAFVPLDLLFALVFGEVGGVDEAFGYSVDVEAVGADEVLDIPHVEDVLGDVFFAFLRCYDGAHDYSVFSVAKLRKIGVTAALRVMDFGVRHRRCRAWGRAFRG